MWRPSMVQPGLPNIPRISNNCSFLIHDEARGSNMHRLNRVQKLCRGFPVGGLLKHRPGEST